MGARKAAAPRRSKQAKGRSKPSKPQRRTGKPAVVAEKGRAAGALPAGVHLSISDLARELGKDRDTIAKRIAARSLIASGERNGYAVYRLKDVLDAFFRFEEHGGVNPDTLSPFERQAHYKAESEKLRLETERGLVVPRPEVEAEYSRMAKIVTQELAVLPDEIERDIGASPLVLERIEAKIDAVRERIYDRIVADEPEAVVEATDAPTEPHESES